jgi:DNA topoisomerase-1
MIEFAEVLPRIRRRIAGEMAKPGLHREKVLATIVRLMDLTLIRVGNEEYARQNGSFGLTTLQDKHARVHRERIRFVFRGKSGKSHAIEVEDRHLARIVKHCQDIPGQDLFQFLDDKGKRRDVTSGDVNDYLRQLTGTDFTAKDFRTWAGTVLAARALSATMEFKTQAQAKRRIKEAIDFVAAQLGNTTAVCRKCYVHPSILNGYMEGQLPCKARAIAQAREKPAATICYRPKASLGLDEREVLQFLRCCRREEERAARAARTKRAAIPRAWQRRLLRGRKAGHR